MVWPQHWFVKFSNLLPHSGWIANPNLPLFSPTCHLFIHRGLDHLGLETVRGTWVISSALSPSSVYSHKVSFHRNWPSMKEGTCNSCNMTHDIVWSDPVHTRSSSPTNACQLWICTTLPSTSGTWKKAPCFVSISSFFLKDLKRPEHYEFIWIYMNLEHIQYNVLNVLLHVLCILPCIW